MTTANNARTFDVVFIDDNNSNSKGFKATEEYCFDYIKNHNGTDESYFSNYKGGVVQVVCNEDGEVIHEEFVF